MKGRYTKQQSLIISSYWSYLSIDTRSNNNYNAALYKHTWAIQKSHKSPLATNCSLLLLLSKALKCSTGSPVQSKQQTEPLVFGISLGLEKLKNPLIYFPWCYRLFLSCMIAWQVSREPHQPLIILKNTNRKTRQPLYATSTLLTFPFLFASIVYGVWYGKSSNFQMTNWCNMSLTRCKIISILVSLTSLCQSKYC